MLIDGYLTGVVFCPHMIFTKKQWAAAGVGFVVAVLVGVQYAKSRIPTVVVSPIDYAATSTSATASSTANSAPIKQVTGPFPINTADTIASWSFQAAYTSDTLVQKANADIAHLVGLMGKGEYDDYDLYLGIGNIKNLLGDGKTAYENYNRSIAIHPNKGLAYANLAHLMDELGAYYTAADAYTKAVTVEPGVLEYHIERLNYLTRQFPADNARVTAALTAASKVFGDTASILAIEAKWLTELKRYADAIKAWETVKMLSPGRDMTAIDTEIARLKAKL
jgi:hypothetical protein